MAATIAALLCAATLAAAAGAQIAFAPCGSSNQFACGHLTVPLDPLGGSPGAITLAIRRHRAPVGEARSAIVALAGGPGQTALGFAEQFDELLGPIAATRDLIVFDQRGTGLSHALHCHALERTSTFASTPAGRVGRCGSEIGPERAFYTTADSVADLEAIRRAGGYEKLLLYGTSYGTKLAEEYAQAYPQRVEALVLDSVVPPAGPDPLNRPTFAALGGVLRAMCRDHACAGITRDPLVDLSRMLARIRRAPLVGRVYDVRGRAHSVRVTPDKLLALLLAGDFSLPARAEFITGARAAANGDPAPIARLLATAEAGGVEGGEGIDIPLFYATSCEEQAFPYSRSADPATRLREALAAARALPAATFTPFTGADAVALDDIPECAGWPYTAPAPAPAPSGPLPSVPTLILSGAEDLRTPTAGAREVAALIAGSHLLVVPFTGHAVLGDEPTPCGREALQALFAGKPVRGCESIPAPPAFLPPPLPPPALSFVAPAGGYHGRSGRTLQAVELTIADLLRQLTLEIGLEDPEGLSVGSLRVGGLRGGWGQVGITAISFDHYSFVPGVTLSGTISGAATDLHVSGPAAAGGTLRQGSQSALVGTLGGLRVRLVASSLGPAAIVARHAPTASSPYVGGGSARRRALARRLAGAVERLLGP
jgi:pimeloyl-ACP methyl ester carboxylesterase